MASPYEGLSSDRWKAVTESLIADHPLSQAEILDAVQVAWTNLWQSRIGNEKDGCTLAEVGPPATVVGAFFERLLARELASRYPGRWLPGAGSQKDLHFVPDERFSIELKTSGQAGFNIYGNRSYAQELQEGSVRKKDKSGYYITVNFHGQALTLVRFGWIDAGDWKSQRASTGQMAGLDKDVYQGKLAELGGVYQLNAPAQLIKGVGPRVMSDLEGLEILTILDLLEHDGELPPRLAKLKEAALEKYKGIR